MWIHLPSTLLASVQDTQESNLDSEKLSQLEQSAMWKSKFLQQRSWQSVWKRDTSIKLLSGLTSKPSTLNHGVEKWISSLEDSHVNPFRLQDTNEEKMTKETYGLTQPDLFGGLGHQSSFLKMCQESSNTISVKSDPNFERWVTKLRKDYSQRSKQAHLTNDNGFSSWRTPAATDPEGGVEDWSSERFKNIEAPQIKLRDQAANWPTPRESNPGSSNSGYGNVLNEEAKNWPTPNTKEIQKWGKPSNPDISSIHQDPMTQKDGHTCSVSCRRLNPLFAEHLMGLPLGWTCVSEPLEMELYQQWQQELSSFLYRN